ncbi:MAG TPA: PAS domain S-box protein, partial [Thermoleophilia bacterium]|nr:PAS domain S-box protein [Thermoleophilia bacterium]
MATAFGDNLDYLLFVYGLGFVLASIALLGLRTTVSSPLPWKWLGFSALFLGLSTWVAMLTVAAGHRGDLDVLRSALFIMGCVSLFEFARVCWAAVGGKRIERWVIAVLLVLVALGGFAGFRGMDAAAGYLLGLTGGLWAAAGMWRYQPADGRHGHPLRLTAGAMALFVTIAFVVVPKTLLVPSTLIDEESFLSTFGFPVQILCIALAVPFVAGLWLHYVALLHEEHPGLADRRGTLYRLAMMASLAVILAAGLHATTLAGDRWDAGARADLLGRTALAASSIDVGEAEALTATPADVGAAGYERLREQLALMDGANQDIRWFHLMALKGSAIVFTVDGIPPDDPGHAEPGTVYDEPPEEFLNVFSGEDITVGPYTDEYGTFVSGIASIRDPETGRTLAVLGLDTEASDWVHALALARVTPILATLVLCLIVFGTAVILERSRLSALIIAEREADYRTVLETTQDGFYRVDPNGDLLMVNPSFARIFGYLSTSEAVGRNLGKDVYQRPEDRVAFLKALAEAGGEIADYEVTLRRADSTLISVSTNAHYYLDFAGNVRGIEGTMRDITERKRAEEELRFTRFAVERADDAVFWLTRAGAFTYANPATCATLGYSLDELCMMTIHDIDPDFPAERWPEHMRELEQAGSLNFETRHRTKAGTIIPMEIRAMHLEYEGDVYDVAFARDIT